MPPPPTPRVPWGAPLPPLPDGGATRFPQNRESRM